MISEEVEKVQVENVRKVKTTRDQAEVDACLQRLQEAAKGEENLMPFIIDAVRAYASLGEICDVFRDVFWHLPRSEMVIGSEKR